MATLLRIDASPREEHSYSRQVASAYESRWRAAHDPARVITRDLGRLPVAHLDADTIRGFFTPPDALTPELRAATALSDVLVAELLMADTLLISTPMYNFSVPSVLKAWIDQVVRVGRTFALHDGRYVGLVRGRNAVVVTASGAAYAGTELAGLDHLHTYLRTLLGFVGFEDIEFISVEHTTVPELGHQSKDAALDRAATLAH